MDLLTSAGGIQLNRHRRSFSFQSTSQVQRLTIIPRHLNYTMVHFGLQYFAPLFIRVRMVEDP
jgi:hypothetical protein